MIKKSTKIQCHPLSRALVLCVLVIGACATPNTIETSNSTNIDQYYEKYPTAPKGQAEHFYSSEYSREVESTFDCIKAHDGFFDSELKHLPSLEVHIGIKGNAENILNRCTDKNIFVPHSVNYSYDELWQKSLEVSKTLESQGIAHNIEVPTARYGRTVVDGIAYNKIMVSVLADNVIPAKSALSMYESDSIFLTHVEILPEEIIETD